MTRDRDGGRGGTLYVVSTPIGNLDDITLRALDVLRSVPLVAAEDTRVTRKLWARHGIKTRLVSYHGASEASRERELLEHLRAGADVALVSDAGTPLVSDPGEGIVAAWAREGGRVEPIPGPSAVLAALVASGLGTPRWRFEGFLARRGKQRREQLQAIARDEAASVLFEAPNRAAATLADLSAACGDERRAAVARELTKLHEEIWRGTLGELARRASESPPRGEVTIVIAGAAHEPSEAARGIVLEDGRAQVDELVKQGKSRSEAAREIAAATGLPRRDLFRVADD